ncbi:MAG: methylaspartate ammonia-lyase [Limnochordia bacterium]|jgi:methylaspartate ammonia-lyase|nr:methylaspartate ammonia-lyase [Bacillota bacterium]NLL07487.1 methylaspartate ammonia-lyase [Bacillota bacterium]HBG09088.1 methylaspartate ammonia-lyase [Bacillota bacterium]
MIIKDVVLSKGLTGFYFDDQRAIRQGNFTENGLTYDGVPVTPGFVKIRQAGESVSIQLVLDDGQVAYGDCAAVQYSGAGGRDPLFLADKYIPQIQEYVVPRLIGRKLTSFRALAEEIDGLRNGEDKPLHTAIRYGVTQAILDAVARSRKLTMAEVIVEEYGLELKAAPVKIFAQTGDDRRLNADRMIIKHVDVLPHGLFNNINKLGRQGEHLRDYLAWLKQRVQELRVDEDYLPDFQVDVYGTIGEAFDNDIEAIGEYTKQLAELVAPHRLAIEGPVDCGSKEEQIRVMAELRAYVDKHNIPVQFVADEWCNTLEDIKDFVLAKAGHMIQIKAPDLGGINNSVEAVLFCREHGVIPYLGGTCNETERSAQITVQLAVATRPRQILSKPGMGVDEGLCICTNEMNRLVALLKSKAR